MEPLWQSAWRVLRELKIDPLHDLAILILGMYPKKVKSDMIKWPGTLSIAAQCTTVKIWKQPSCLLKEAEIKEVVVHLPHGILLRHLKVRNPTIFNKIVPKWRPTCSVE